MGSTTNHGLRYPENANGVAVPEDIKKLAEDVDGKLISAAGGIIPGDTDFTGEVTVQAPSNGANPTTKTYVDTQLAGKANLPVTTGQIADGTITGTDIATDTITSTNIAPNAVGSSELADNSVDTAAIQDGVVTPTKISGIGNLLTPLQASFETGVLPAIGSSLGTISLQQCTVAPDSGTMLVTITDTAPRIKWSGSNANNFGNLPVVPGEQYTMAVQVSSAVVGMTIRPTVLLFNSAGSSTGMTTVDPGVSTAVASDGTWLLLPFTVPAGKTAATLDIRVYGAAVAGNTFRVLKAGYWKGTGGNWQKPGEPIIGAYSQNARYPTDALLDSAVTTSKIADRTVTPAKISGIGNLVSNVQATMTGATVAASGWYAKNLAGSTSGFSILTMALDPTTLIDGYPTLRSTITPGSSFGSASPSTRDMRTAVTPNETITISMSYLASGVGSPRIRLQFCDSGGTVIGSAVNGNPAACTDTVPAVSQWTGVVPSNAASVVVTTLISPSVVSTGAEWFAQSEFGVWRGAGGNWALQGNPIIGQTPIPVTGKGQLQIGTSTNTLADLPLPHASDAGHVLISDPAGTKGAQWANVTPVRPSLTSGRFILPGQTYGTIVPNSSRFLGSPVHIGNSVTIDAYQVEITANASAADRRIGCALYQMTTGGWRLVSGSSVGSGSDSSVNWPTVVIGETGVKTLTLAAPLTLAPGIYIPVALHAYTQSGLTFRGVASNYLVSSTGVRLFDLSAQTPGGFNASTGGVVWTSTLDLQPSLSYPAPTAVGLRLL